MRITLPLGVAYKKFKHIPGNIWRGKRRLIRKVQPHDINQAKRALDIEERNMFYLRHPYLTYKEYRGVGRDFFTTHEKFLDRHVQEKFDKFQKTVEPRTIDSYFRLRILKDNAWE